MKSLLTILFLFTLACASLPVPVATRPIDSNVLREDWSIHVVTIDPDGAERVTRVWIALEDGDPTIRTNESRWWSNLERDPAIRIRVNDTDYLFESESVLEFANRARIDEAFQAKYGGWERVLFPQDRGRTHVNYARLRAESNAPR
jgi:hypothetical protein